MAKKNYYKMLGVSRTASPEEISAAKNRLAKKYHPDANMKNGIDTTRKMQQILEAYRILSDPKKRASYDRKVFGKPSAGADRNFDLFNLHNMEETAPVTGTPFVNYWRAADSLYDITLESEQFFKENDRFVRDPSRVELGNIITPEGAEKALGYQQMDYYVPVRILEEE